LAIVLKDIAEKANMSVATVSRALRNRKEISQETRDLVQKIASGLRYRPNELARSMLSGRSGNIGVIFPEGAVGTDFCMQILIGIHSELSQMDRHAICLWSNTFAYNNSDENVAAQIHSLIDKRVDGFIINPTIDARKTYIKEVLDRNIPMITVDMDLMSNDVDFVGTDDLAGSAMAVQYLMKLGHNRIVHIAGSRTSSTAILRKEGFLKAVHEAENIQASVIEDPMFGTDLKLSVEIAQRALDADPRPTAIFCANDYIASAVYKAARRKNLRIPEDLSIVGFADMEISRLLDPPLTTVHQNPFQIGVSAVRLLIQQTDEKIQDKTLNRILLKPELIIRESATMPPKNSL
jgi:DNA-binding LacI/PurR family transcriptional regulator